MMHLPSSLDRALFANLAKLFKLVHSIELTNAMNTH